MKTPNAHPMEACMLDLSPSGARLRVPEAVRVGENVRIEAPELLLSGTVKRCCLMHGGHEVLSLPLEVSDELRKLNAALLAEAEPA
jgi:PilZ domain